MEKRKLTDIKSGDFVASGGVRGTDGKIHAVEVRIFPEELRGTGEGDTTLLKPGAAVLTIARKQADGSLVTNRVTAEKDGVKPPM